MNNLNLKNKNHGFSLKEITKAELKVNLLRFNNIFIDVRRKSEHSENVEILKKLKLEPIPIGTSKKLKKKVKTQPEIIETEEYKITKIEDLEGINPTFLKKLNDLGIDSPAKIMDENIKELAKLINSTQKLIKSWRAQITGEN